MGGVSGHSNHSALFFALQHLVEREVMPRREYWGVGVGVGGWVGDEGEIVCVCV